MSRSTAFFPLYPTSKSKTGAVPSWPAFSIGFLVILAAIFPAGLITGMNLYLLLLALIVWFASGKPFDRDLLRMVIAPFALIVVIGLVVGFEADRYLYLKDAWYISNPAVVMCVGYVLFRNMPDLMRGLRAFVIGGTMLALLHLGKVAAHPELFSLSAVDIRSEVGTGYYAPALAISILFALRGNWAKGLKLPGWLAWLCIVLCAAAVISSFSRTMFIVAFIGLVASLGVFARREWLRVGGVIAFAVLVILALRLSVDVNSNEASKSFVGKLARSTDELTVEEYTDFKSINLNWRGYETARALNYYTSGEPIDWLFGYGFGAQLDLGLFMHLGDRREAAIRFVPLLHNGYPYLLLKGGISAVALFGYSLFELYRLGRRKAAGAPQEPGTIAGRLLQGVVVTLLFTTWVITGVFNKLAMFPFLILAGFLIGFLTRQWEAQK